MTATSLTRSQVVAAPPERVWATLAAFDQISRWAANVDHSAYTTTRTEGVGAARRVQAGRIALIETVVEWDPTTRLAYTLDGLPPLAKRVVNQWDLGPDGDDSDRTVATLTTLIEPSAGPRGRIGAKVLARVLTKASDAMLDGLAAHDHLAATHDHPASEGPAHE